MKKPSNTLMFVFKAKPCSERETKCADKMMCFAETSRCDGFPTCSDKSDEDNCTGMTFAVIYDSFKLSLPHIINQIIN